MRLPPRTAPKPEHRTYDVVISQACGKPANGYTVRQHPTGGSEWQVVVLAEALAERGYRVAVLTPDGACSRFAKVDYLPLKLVLGAYQDAVTGEPRPALSVSTEVLISERFGELPIGVEFNRLVFDLHDLPDPRLQHVMQAFATTPATRVVVHSDFMLELLADWPRVAVIPCMLPDSFYTPTIAPPEGERVFVYASAALKGLEPTLAAWTQLVKTSYFFKRAQLIVTSPGYDVPSRDALAKAKNVALYTGLSPAGVQELLSRSHGIFAVSTYPETFGIAFAQAEAAGRPAFVLQLHSGDALKTTLANDTVTSNPKAFEASLNQKQLPAVAESNDFRVSTHIEAWITVLGLGRPQSTQDQESK